jgi:hypothetical protein
MWTYFPVIASSSNSSSVTKYESRIEAGLSALQQQQAFSNSALDARRKTLAKSRPSARLLKQPGAAFYLTWVRPGTEGFSPN